MQKAHTAIAAVVFLVIGCAIGYFVADRRTAANIQAYKKHQDELLWNHIFKAQTANVRAYLDFAEHIPDRKRRQYQLEALEEVVHWDVLHEEKYTREQRTEMKELGARLRASLAEYPFEYDEPGKGFFTKKAVEARLERVCR